ncbi:SDR family oxidoreductase [Shewanella intestini]|uniref:SDR family oxidoreductase n=1 Tax=Shewanella intestini TaxID=2017544 RepID=A0ABS5HZ04_9GAMM|nr:MULTISPECIES: SDR family oxidoreductase [Shewanella]MBR9727022.1 SDR family oxidoreductase [Shewanella intestini]MRG35823.1 SDR family NAD(P)-dependent oxidoreductase [Shewanella sp. XMDDZSB0408]
MSINTQFGAHGWTPQHIGSLAGKTYVITGANTGAGYEATKLLLSKKAKVVMLNRNEQKSLQAIKTLKAELGDKADVAFIQLDLAQLSSVREAAAKVLESVDHIDALICNAAIAQVAKQQITVDGFESQMGVNHYAHFLLCGLLFERIEASIGRIVVVGSNAYKMGKKTIQFDDINFDKKYTAWDSYAQSKLAQMMFAYELQRKVGLAGKQVQVQVCHPGASRTNLLKDTASRLNKIIWSIAAPLIAQSATKGAWPEVMCAVEQGLTANTLYGPTKRAQTVGAIDQCPLDDVALNHTQARALWALSCEKTGLDWDVN